MPKHQKVQKKPIEIILARILQFCNQQKLTLHTENLDGALLEKTYYFYCVYSYYFWLPK